MDSQNNNNSFALIINNFGHKKPRQFFNTGKFFVQKSPKYNYHKTEYNGNVINNQSPTNNSFNCKRTSGKNHKRRKRKKENNTLTKEIQMESSEGIKKHKKRKGKTFEIVKNNYYEDGSELRQNTAIKYKKHIIRSKKELHFMPNEMRVNKSSKVFEQETSPTYLTQYSAKSFYNFPKNCNQINQYEQNKNNFVNSTDSTYNCGSLLNNCEPYEKQDSELFYFDISGNKKECSSNILNENDSLKNMFQNKIRNHVKKGKYSTNKSYKIYSDVVHIIKKNNGKNQNQPETSTLVEVSDTDDDIGKINNFTFSKKIKSRKNTSSEEEIKKKSSDHDTFNIFEKPSQADIKQSKKKRKKRYYEITQSDKFNLKNSENSELNTSFVCSENEKSYSFKPKKRKRSINEEEMNRTDSNFESTPIKRKKINEKDLSFKSPSEIILKDEITSSNENIVSLVNISEDNNTSKKKKKHKTKEINIQNNIFNGVENPLNSLHFEIDNEYKLVKTKKKKKKFQVEDNISNYAEENEEMHNNFESSCYNDKKNDNGKSSEEYQLQKEDKTNRVDGNKNVLTDISETNNLKNKLFNNHILLKKHNENTKLKSHLSQYRSESIHNDCQISTIISESECEIIDSINPSSKEKNNSTVAVNSKIPRSKKKRKIKEKLAIDSIHESPENPDTSNDFQEMSTSYDDSEQSVCSTISKLISPKVKKSKFCQNENVTLKADRSVFQEVDQENYNEECDVSKNLSGKNFEHSNTNGRKLKKLELTKTNVSKSNIINEDDDSFNNSEIISHNLKSKESVTEIILSPKKKKSSKTKTDTTQGSSQKIKKLHSSKFLKGKNVDNGNILREKLELSEIYASNTIVEDNDSSSNSDIISHDLKLNKSVTKHNKQQKMEKHDGSNHLKGKSDTIIEHDDASNNSEIISPNLRLDKLGTQEIVLSPKNKTSSKTKVGIIQDWLQKIEKHHDSKYLKDENIDHSNTLGKKLELSKTNVSKSNTTIDDSSHHSETVSPVLKSNQTEITENFLSPKRQTSSKSKVDTTQELLQTTIIEDDTSNSSETISPDLKSNKSVTQEIALSPKKKTSIKTKVDTTPELSEKVEKHHGSKYLKDEKIDNSNTLGKKLELSKTIVSKSNITIDDSSDTSEIISPHLKSKKSVTQEIALSPKKNTLSKAKVDTTQELSKKVKKHHETAVDYEGDVSEIDNGSEDSNDETANQKMHNKSFSVSSSIFRKEKKQSSCDDKETSQKQECMKKHENNKRKIKQWFKEHVYSDSEDSEEDEDKSGTYVPEEFSDSDDSGENEEKSGTYLPEEFSSDPEELKEEKDKLKELSVILPFPVPPLHAIATRTTIPTKDQRKKIEKLNLPVKTGHFSQSEDDKIMENWKQFCKEYDVSPNPSLFIKFPRGMRSNEKMNILRYIGHGLDNRMINGIYLRFKLLLQKRNLKLGRFTPEEDERILDFMRNTTSRHPFLDLANMLDRTQASVEVRYKRLLTGTREKINYSSPEMADKFVKALMKIAKCDKIKRLKHREFTDEEWRMLSISLEGIPVKNLQRAWKVTIYPRLFSRETNLKDVKEDIVILLHDRKETDWKTVDWKEIAKYFKGVSAEYLYMTFKHLVHYHVPKTKRGNLKESLDFLMNNLYLLNAARELKKFVMKNGRITYES